MYIWGDTQKREIHKHTPRQTDEHTRVCIELLRTSKNHLLQQLPYCPVLVSLSCLVFVMQLILPAAAIYCSSLKCILIKLQSKWYKFCRVRTWRRGRTIIYKGLVVRCTLRLCPQLLPGWPLVRHQSEIRLHVEWAKYTFQLSGSVLWNWSCCSWP